MKQKDLAEKYARKAYARVNGENDLIFEDNRCFTFDDIKAAFNAGRDSVVENMPKLKWAKVFEDGPYIAISSLGISYKIEFSCNEFHLFCNGEYVSCYISLFGAKQVANENYKKRIKQALGL